MGKKKDKKGKGAEKTLAKTDKKLSNKLKKELQAIGEDDIESIVRQIEQEEQKRLEVTEKTVEPPSRRLNFSFIAHPDQDQLILFGGEFFNGQKTFLYNDLFFYNIASGSWTLVKAPGGPPPRCGHQMVATSANKGELWVFGGEYSSPTQSQFYHYRDLWVYRLAEKKWTKITASNGPSARNGHRMVMSKKQLIVFGGFHDNLRNYKYFNDCYSFNTETYTWTKLEPVGTPPSPRSGCCLVPLNDGRILLYGGYSKEQIKKDVDKGHVFSDSFILTVDKNNPNKWKWLQQKLGGYLPARCSMPMAVSPNNLTAFCFGGVFDREEDEEDLTGQFFNDFSCLDLEKFLWRPVTLTGKKDKTKKKKEESSSEEVAEEMEVEQEESKPTIISDDGIFTVSLRPASSNTTKPNTNTTKLQEKLFQPSPRMNCGLAIKHGQIFLYGGMYEEGDKQITFNDFYSIDAKKLDEWKVLVQDDSSSQEWLGSDSEEESDSSSDSEEMETD